MSELVVVTDFDGTLMEQDVGDSIMDTLGINDTQEMQEVTRRFWGKEVGSKHWVLTGYGKVRERQQELDDVLHTIRPREGASAFLAYCRGHGVPVTVLSDGMEYYIRWLMERHGLAADEIIANPIRFEADGTYSLGLQNRNPACDWCGCCKADVVRSIKASGARVVYIGDGISDTYGSVFADIVFARASLARYLEEQGKPFYRFETFHDVLQIIQPLVEQTADAKAQSDHATVPGHPFCRFA
jgi:2,3-diketo-5-methylthio-1-phosphopentane phosphatase